MWATSSAIQLRCLLQTLLDGRRQAEPPAAEAPRSASRMACLYDMHSGTSSTHTHTEISMLADKQATSDASEHADQLDEIFVVYDTIAPVLMLWVLLKAMSQQPT